VSVGPAVDEYVLGWQLNVVGSVVAAGAHVPSTCAGAPVAVTAVLEATVTCAPLSPASSATAKVGASPVIVPDAG
jgi:hypothetical protein